MTTLEWATAACTQALADAEAGNRAVLTRIEQSPAARHYLENVVRLAVWLPWEWKRRNPDLYATLVRLQAEFKGSASLRDYGDLLEQARKALIAANQRLTAVETDLQAALARIEALEAAQP